ncbi:MAG: hypothetical protein RIQ81_1554 [Pseudomonadota bacterium]|jgi:hypothetical protein
MLVISFVLPLIALARVAWVLANPGAGEAVRPLADLDVGLPGFALGLAGSPEAEGVFQASATISTASAAMAEADEITLEVADFGDRIDFLEFVILDAESTQTLFAADPVTFRGHSAIQLKRKAPRPASSGDDIRTYRLQARFRGAGGFGLWAQMPPRPESIERAGLVMTSGSTKGVLWGTWRSGRRFVPVSRWAMLRFVWDGRVLPVAVLIGAFLVLGAAGWCSYRSIVFQVPGTVSSRTYATGTVFLLALAVTAAYSVLCPPFHAPDEPDHLLTLTKGAGAAKLEASALDLARKGYFESIKFRPNVTFAAEFMDTPEKLSWAKHIADTGDQHIRSPLATKTWPVLGGWLSGLDAADALLLLRLINAAMFVAAFGIFLWAVPAGHRATLGLVLLTIPALPFFAMHWSNHAMAVAGMLASSGLIVRLILGATLPLAAFFAWGALCGLSFLSGVTGTAVLFFSATIAFMVVFVRGKPWFIVVAGMLFSGAALAVLGLMTAPGYFDLIVQRIIRAWPTTGEWLRANNFLLWVSGLVFGFVFVTSCIRWGILRLEGSFSELVQVSGRIRKRVNQGMFFLVCSQALLWAVFFLVPVWPLRLELQGIESESGPGVEIWNYGLKAVSTFFSGFGLLGRDFLTSDSFWGGFGWLDAVPSARILQPLKAIPGIGISLILWRAIREKELSLWLWFQYITLLTAACVFAFAAGAFQIPANLHGRYLVGPFVLFISVCGIGISSYVCALGESGRKAARQLMFVAVVSLHAVCFRHLLLRYFGSL